MNFWIWQSSAVEVSYLIYESLAKWIFPSGVMIKIDSTVAGRLQVVDDQFRFIYDFDFLIKLRDLVFLNQSDKHYLSES